MIARIWVSDTPGAVGAVLREFRREEKSSFVAPVMSMGQGAVYGIGWIVARKVVKRFE